MISYVADNMIRFSANSWRIATRIVLSLKIQFHFELIAASYLIIASFIMLMLAMKIDAVIKYKDLSIFQVLTR